MVTKIKFGLLVIVALVLTAAVSASTYHIIDDNHFGCVDKDDYKKMIKYLVDGDQDAFKSEMLNLMTQGKATIFKTGETVYLEDTSIWEGLIQVRRAGETTAYWTALEAAKRDQ